MSENDTLGLMKSIYSFFFFFFNHCVFFPHQVEHTVKHPLWLNLAVGHIPASESSKFEWEGLFEVELVFVYIKASSITVQTRSVALL